MRVAPFVNGEELESLSIPNMSDFLKISSVRGMPGVAHDHPAIQVVDRALELLYLRVFSCDFNPEELPPPDDPRLQLPGQQYTSYSLESEVKDEQSSEQRIGSDGASQCASDNHLHSAGDCSVQTPAFDQEVTLTNAQRSQSEITGFVSEKAANCLPGYTPGIGGQTRLQKPQSMLNGLPEDPMANNGKSRMQVEPLHHAASLPDFGVQSEPSYASVMQPRMREEHSEQRDRASERGRRSYAVPPFIIRKNLGNRNNFFAAGGMGQHGEQPQQRYCPSQSQVVTPTGHEERVHRVKVEENR
ncbi:hypothetical protein Emag_006639 [Eimeria magna]